MSGISHSQKNIGLPIKPVIDVAGREYSPMHGQPWYAEHGRCINSGAYDGLEYQAAVDAIAADLSRLKLGEKQTTWRLRDWGISRQRYWGCPIPIIHCASCGTVPVPDEHLPVVLPTNLVPDGSGNPLLQGRGVPGGPLSKMRRRGAARNRHHGHVRGFVLVFPAVRQCRTTIRRCSMRASGTGCRSINTSAGSSTRFCTCCMRASGRGSCTNWDWSAFKEPFANLFTQGMVLNEVFFRKPDAGRVEYFNPADVEITLDKTAQRRVAVLRSDGEEVESGGVVTMSKSKNNGVDPQALVDEFGADTARLFTMFAAPPEQTLEWSDEGVQGAYRFIKRLWKAVHDHVARGPAAALDKAALNDAQRDDSAAGPPDLGEDHR